MEPVAEPWTFGVEPLDQTVRAADVLRRISGLVLALESEDAAVDRLIEDIERAEAELVGRIPAGSAPRVGAAAEGNGRVYVDHARHVGHFNSAFPEYDIAVHGNRAEGTVNFPVVFEGPPGLVHGGFLAVLFDLVVQHHNCEVGVAGKTTSLQLRYRRPTPLLTDLTFTVERRVDGDRILSTAGLHLEGKTVCEAEAEAIAGVRANLPVVSPRRDPGRDAS